ncbi:MAG: HAD-IIB family hydrolase, partial [Bdellovibrionales bacterium]|nr:HAD-IIB family hydrolase [Bdellovibrionales bacterium]
GALWRLKEAGFCLVPVTGRPAGWCDHIARFWPVDAVIGENGAFIFYMGESRLKRFDLLEDSERAVNQQQLVKLRELISQQFDQACWASDQQYREYDLAVDYCEDVTPWSSQKLQQLMELCRKAGANFKLSSIHLNIWFGDYTKRSAIESWLLSGAVGAPFSPPPLADWIYVGDSPNDAPAFELFRQSVGVANIAPYLDTIDHCPTWLALGEGGEGFLELADALIGAK